MNKRQLEVQRIQADDEARVIRQLKQVYMQARKDCEFKIRELSSRTDMENLQSIIWQKQYQEALKKQLDSILDALNSTSFTTVADYLAGCYENGFIGTLYDLQGQGIPLCFPINQTEVTRAIQVDSKISQGLYKRMGEDTDKLKKSIRAEISRGISNGSSWNQIAVKIALGMNSPFNKAYNRTIGIARTEGHRIQQESAYHCQQHARSRGADVVKQWDSTLDGKTRPHHVELDGQIRDVEEPFEVAGMKAMYPGAFGNPSEDCNCRCCLLQRAKWALSEEEYYTKWNGNKRELVKVEAKTYNEFKETVKTILKKQVHPRFVPAKSLEEAEQFARSLGMECSYKGIDLQVANDMNAAFWRGMEYCPEIKNRLNFVGSGQQRNKLYKAELTEYYLAKLKAEYPGMSDEWYSKYAKSFASKSVGKIDRRTYAFASRCREDVTGGIQTKYTGIAVNDVWGGNLAKFLNVLESDVKAKWHPEGCNTVSSVFDHEIGHQIDYAVGLRTNRELTKLWSSLSRSEIKEGLSGYGAESIAEFIAEGYAEYCNNPNPRELATKIGQIIEKAVKAND